MNLFNLLIKIILFRIKEYYCLLLYKNILQFMESDLDNVEICKEVPGRQFLFYEKNHNLEL